MKKTYKIDVDCANCANKMEEAAKNTAGVKNATVNFMTLKMIVEFEDGQEPKAVMQEVLKNCKKVEDDCADLLIRRERNAESPGVCPEGLGTCPHALRQPPNRESRAVRLFQNESRGNASPRSYKLAALARNNPKFSIIKGGHAPAA